MKFSAISDVHVKQPHDEADKLLMSFLAHPIVENSDHILLLGDIFDLMCGPHDEYLKIYSHIFRRMEELRQKGKQLHFIEGNHDVHLEILFKKYWPSEEIVATKKPFILENNGRTYYFSHGDEHEVDNISYQRYKKIIHSVPLTVLANYLLPYAVLNFFGERASKVSRKKGYKAFNEEVVRDRFRKGVGVTTQGKYDFVVGGHSHVQDQYRIPNTKQTYINNGYALRTKTFIYIDEDRVSFITLS